MVANFKRKVFPNGFTLLFEKRAVPVVSVSLTVRSGGIYESDSEKGISHFIEHMLYKGTKKRSAKDIAFEIEKNGGELNGFTTETFTSFWCKMPSINLNIALDVLGDLVKNPKFDEKEMEKEKKVIFEEMKMRKDSARHYVFDKIQSMLYDGSLGKELIGTKKTLNSFNRNDLVNWFKKYYVSSNMVLTVVGDANYRALCMWARKNFSGGKKLKIVEQPFRKKNKSFVESRGGIDQSNFVFAYHSPLSNENLIYAETILITLLTGGLSSRLFYEIREKRNLAYGVGGDVNSNLKYSYSMIFVGAKKENLGEIKKIILNEFLEVSKNLDEKELNQIKKQLIGNYQISMEDSQSQMVNLLGEEVCGDAKEYYKFSEKISSVKLEDVKKLASRVKEGNYSTFTLIPK